MSTNEGSIDRAVRVAVGLLLLALVFVGPRSGWFAPFGVILLMTGLAGFCPLYRLVGIRTCKVP